MLQQPLQQLFWRHGHALIGTGVLLIVAAFFLPQVPMVTALALIGRGAVLTLQTNIRTARQDSLVMINLATYGVLVCLAIVAQSNAVLQESQQRVGLMMLLDHAAAIVILLGLVTRVYFRLIQPTT